MVTIHLDDMTTQARKSQAQNAGMSLGEFLRSLVSPPALRLRAN